LRNAAPAVPIAVRPIDGIGTDNGNESRIFRTVGKLRKHQEGAGKDWHRPCNRGRRLSRGGPAKWIGRLTRLASGPARDGLAKEE
jgi:hypothetical protein